MSNEFEYNAPQFRDFNDFDDSDGADTFFDVESDVLPVINGKVENKENSQPTVAETLQVKKGSGTPSASKPVGTVKPSINLQLSVEKKSNSPTSTNLKRRSILKAVRRLSINQNDTVAPPSVLTENLSKDLNKLSVNMKRRTCFEGISLNKQEEKSHAMTTRRDEAAKTPTIELRNRVVNKEDVKSRKRKSDVGEHKYNGKYMAMAEQILHFQRDTPPRFHTNKRRSSVSGSRHSMFKSRQSYNPRRTIALTPKLMTKLRSRPSEIPSLQEKEEMEVEEMKKQQIKANPLNEKIFKTPKLPPKIEKPRTVQEPFNITTVFKKPEVPKPAEEPFKFTAKPAPKKILKKPVGVGPKPELPITVPQSPAITKSTRFQKPVRVAAYSNDNKQSTEDLLSFGVPYCHVPRKTVVKPFSFEVRDKEMLEKKEQKIKEVIEAEKKAREFKANPLPSFSVPKEINRSSKHSHLDCSRSSTSSVSNEESSRPFRARSPRVLRKKPFEPKLEHSHSQPMEVQLWTERRAEDRHLHEMKQQDNERRLALLKEQVEMEKKRKEEEELAKLRKEIVHKPLPMPKFKQPPEHPSSTMPLTNPKSPMFSKRTRTQPHCK